MKNRVLFVAAILGLLGVGLGAFGAHALKDLLAENGYEHVFKTASFYHITHTIVLLIAGLLLEKKDDKWIRRAAYSFFFGILLFSGSLYALAVSEVKALGMITPIGGLLLMMGWGMLAIAFVLKSKH